MEGQKLIDQFHKNSIELVEVNLTEWKAQEYIDIRIYYLPDPVNEKDRLPTKKGVCLNIEHLPRLIQALQKAQKLLKKMHESAQDKSLEQG